MAQVMVCHACDLVLRAADPPAIGRLHCPRCRAPLKVPERGHIDSALAVACATLALFVLANLYPLVTLYVGGSTRETTLGGAAQGLYAQGYRSLAALVLFTTVIAPGLQIASVLYLLVPLRRGLAAAHSATVMRVLAQVRSWSFIEVFMLGALVALVRLTKYADVLPGVSLWACGLLMIGLAALTSLTTPEQLWRWHEELAGQVHAGSRAAAHE